MIYEIIQSSFKLFALSFPDESALFTCRSSRRGGAAAPGLSSKSRDGAEYRSPLLSNYIPRAAAAPRKDGHFYKRDWSRKGKSFITILINNYLICKNVWRNIIKHSTSGS